MKWPTSGPCGYITPPPRGVPSACDWETKSQVAHNWARWLHTPHRAACQQRFTTGHKIGGGPQLGQVALSAQWPRGSPTLQSGGQVQRRPTNGPNGYIIHTAWRVHNTSLRGTKLAVAHKWAKWLHNPYGLGVPNASERGTKSKVAHKWAGWLHHPYCVAGCPTVQRGAK